MPFFKIRNKTTGLFSTGGESPGFRKAGKVWTNRGGVTSHLGLVARIGQVYADCEIVEFEMVEVRVTTIQESLQGIADRKKAREAENAARIAEWNRQQELAELKRLQDKYGKV
jgi:hypothetical protein